MTSKPMIHRGILRTNKHTVYATCNCGWVGPERWLTSAALADLEAHQNERP